MSEFAEPPHQKPKSSTGKIIALVGCGCLSIMVVIAIVIAIIFMGVFKLLKSSDAYQDTIAAVQSNPAAIEALGEPIEPGFFVNGSINLNNGVGDADLTIPVSGPKGSGNIHVVAEKPAGSPNWIYSKRELTVTGQSEAIPLGP